MYGRLLTAAPVIVLCVVIAGALLLADAGRPDYTKSPERVVAALTEVRQELGDDARVASVTVRPRHVRIAVVRGDTLYVRHFGRVGRGRVELPDTEQRLAEPLDDGLPRLAEVATDPGRPSVAR